MKVAELTVEELEAMIRRVVDQALAEHGPHDAAIHAEQSIWVQAGANHLAAFYSDDEPRYSEADLKPWR